MRMNICELCSSISETYKDNAKKVVLFHIMFNHSLVVVQIMDFKLKLLILTNTAVRLVILLRIMTQYREVAVILRVVVFL